MRMNVASLCLYGFLIEARIDPECYVLLLPPARLQLEARIAELLPEVERERQAKMQEKHAHVTIRNDFVWGCHSLEARMHKNSLLEKRLQDFKSFLGRIR